MTDPGAPRHGRHSSARYPVQWTGREPDLADRVARRYDVDAGRSTAGHQARLLSDDDRTGPLLGGPLDPAPLGDRYAVRARHAADDPRDAEHPSGPVDWPPTGYVPDGRHPSGPLPPRPAGVWDKLHRRDDEHADDDTATVAHPLPAAGHDQYLHDEHLHDPADDHLDEHPVEWQDATGGLEVIGEHVDERRRGRRGRRAARAQADDHEHLDHDHGYDDHAPEDELALHAAERSGRRRRRRPVVTVLMLVLLLGVVGGVLYGGKTLLGIVNPTAEDYSGAGTGTVAVKVEHGDTLSAIATRLVDAGVIASAGPFIDAAEANTAAAGIQPGTYALREKMSGQAALDLMLDPAALQLSRVTVPEGMTVAATLKKVSDETGVPLEQLQAAAKDPAAIGVPSYLPTAEGLLFPATYDFQPDATPTDMLTAMVSRGLQALDQLQVPEEDRLTVLTKASLVQAEASSPEDMAKVARVLENRLSDGMPLQLDTTVNYANGKGGITTTPQDRQNQSPYNTYVHKGLPPGPITNPGEEALTAVQNPATGPWRFFVVVNPDTGETRFAETAEQHQQNVLLFQQWLRENPGG